MKLGAPYYSQRLDILDPECKWRSCGICALAMAMDSLRRPTSKLGNLDDLIKEGLASGAYLNGVGWIHQGLVELAKKHGFENSFRKEWAEDKKNEAVKYLAEFLKKEIPVLASMKNTGGGHLVLIVGLEEGGDVPEGFYIHDPNAYTRKDGEFKFLNLSEFLKIWKGKVVVIG